MCLWAQVKVDWLCRPMPPIPQVTADWLYRFLRREGLSTTTIHGDREQHEREADKGQG